MSTDQADYKLRFHAGKFEEGLLSLILILQLTLGVMLAFVLLAWIHLILDSYISPRTTVFYPEVLSVLIGTVGVLYLLHLLYE